MAYRDNVDLAATALQRGEDANWELARLTFENTWDHVAGGRDERVSMDHWCADVRAASGRKFSIAAGDHYKMIWRQFGLLPDHERPSWTDASYGIRSMPPERRVDVDAASYSRRASPEAKREIFQTLAADPVIVEHAAEIGTPTSQAVSKLTHDAYVIREQRREQAIEADPISRRLERQRAALDLEASCNQFAQDCVRFAREITDLLPATGEADPDDLAWIARAIERGRTALDQLEVYISTGRTDLDAFLENVLGGKSS
jgi:hypothetical protein